MQHPERTGRQVGDKWRQVGDKPAIMRAENAECARQVGDECEIVRTKAFTSSSVYWETGEWETSGDKWETNVKSCGQSIQCALHAGKQARRQM